MESSMKKDGRFLKSSQQTEENLLKRKAVKSSAENTMDSPDDNCRSQIKKSASSSAKRVLAEATEVASVPQTTSANSVREYVENVREPKTCIFFIVLNYTCENYTYMTFLAYSTPYT